MNKIDIKLQELKAKKRMGIMAHVVVGYPSYAKTIEIVQLMDSIGVDFVELQIPFSDPIADGPTIMKACDISLKNGTRVKDSFKIAENLFAKVSLPLLFMSYFNPLFRYKVRDFCRDAEQVGVSGLIVPDLSLEEDNKEKFTDSCLKNNLYPIRVISPVTSSERIQKNAIATRGFLYCSARQGITGVRDSLSSSLTKYLSHVADITTTPLAVGFGVSTPEHVKALKPYADIIVVGSAVLEVIEQSQEKDMLKNVAKFLKNLMV